MPTPEVAEAARYVILAEDATLHSVPDGAPAFRREAGSPPMVARVVDMREGWVRVSTAAAEDRCLPTFASMLPWELLVWVPEAAIAPTVSSVLTVGRVEVYPGAALGPEEAGVRVAGSASVKATVPVPADVVTPVFTYVPIPDPKRVTVQVLGGEVSVDGHPVAFSGLVGAVPEAKGGAAMVSGCVAVHLTRQEAATARATEPPAPRAPSTGSGGEGDGSSHTGPRVAVEAGTRLYWPDGTLAGRTTGALNPYLADLTVEGERRCMRVTLLGGWGEAEPAPRVCFAE